MTKTSTRARQAQQHQHNNTTTHQQRPSTFRFVDAVPLHERLRHAAQGVHHVLVRQVAPAQAARPLGTEVRALPSPNQRLHDNDNSRGGGGLYTHPSGRIHPRNNSHAKEQHQSHQLQHHDHHHGQPNQKPRARNTPPHPH